MSLLLEKVSIFRKLRSALAVTFIACLFGALLPGICLSGNYEPVDLGIIGSGDLDIKHIDQSGGLVGSDQIGSFYYKDFELHYLGMNGYHSNVLGQVVGRNSNGNISVWENGIVTDLGIAGYGLAINIHGQIVGSLGNEAVLIDNGEITYLDTLFGVRSSANDINDNGVVALDINDPNIPFKSERGYIWDNGELTLIGTFGLDSNATRINNSGYVLG